MLRYMLDANVCVRAMRVDPTSKLAGRFNRHSLQLTISSVVLAELYYGAENSQNVAGNLVRIDKFAARLPEILDFDAAAAADYGRIKTLLRQNPIGPLDTLIAAHARSRQLIVVTGNAHEFGRVPGLVVEDWL
jgi:tRNA(fMet)-specific endonuclease VapC